MLHYWYTPMDLVSVLDAISNTATIGAVVGGIGILVRWLIKSVTAHVDRLIHFVDQLNETATKRHDSMQNKIQDIHIDVSESRVDIHGLKQGVESTKEEVSEIRAFVCAQKQRSDHSEDLILSRLKEIERNCPRMSGKGD